MSISSHPEQGFTLIEVLVALVLLALLSLVSWRGLDAVDRVSGRLDEQSEATLSLMRALSQIERDLQRHATVDVMPAWPVVGGGLPAPDLAFPAPGLMWGRGSGLHIVRSSGDGLWQRLHWTVYQGVLYRAAGMPSYRLPLPEPGTPVAVLDRVRAWSLREWRSGQGWADPQSAPVGQSSAGRVPKAQDMGLEVVLHRMEKGASQSYRKVVLLP